MDNKTQKTIESVINTLNSISVFGKKNLDMLLACILALENVLDADEGDTNKFPE